jgi:hypothetical protein
LISCSLADLPEKDNLQVPQSIQILFFKLGYKSRTFVIKSTSFCDNSKISLIEPLLSIFILKQPSASINPANQLFKKVGWFNVKVVVDKSILKKA